MTNPNQNTPPPTRIIKIPEKARWQDVKKAGSLEPAFLWRNEDNNRKRPLLYSGAGYIFNGSGPISTPPCCDLRVRRRNLSGGEEFRRTRQARPRPHLVIRRTASPGCRIKTTPQAGLQGEPDHICPLKEPMMLSPRPPRRKSNALQDRSARHGG